MQETEMGHPKTSIPPSANDTLRVRQLVMANFLVCEDNAKQSKAKQCDEMQSNAMQFHTMQCNEIQSIPRHKFDVQLS